MVEVGVIKKYTGPTGREANVTCIKTEELLRMLNEACWVSLWLRIDVCHCSGPWAVAICLLL